MTETKKPARHVRVEREFWRTMRGADLHSLACDGLLIRMASVAADYDDGIVRDAFVTSLAGRHRKRLLANLEAAGEIRREGSGWIVLGPFSIVSRSQSRRVGLSAATRFAVLRRDSFRCVYCGASGTSKTLHVDHVQPVSKGGTNDPENLVTSCQPCNLGKSDEELEIQ